MLACLAQVVLRYSERTGRDEADILREVQEHGGGLDPKKQTRTESFFMECMYLVGRAA